MKPRLSEGPGQVSFKIFHISVYPRHGQSQPRRPERPWQGSSKALHINRQAHKRFEGLPHVSFGLPCAPPGPATNFHRPGSCPKVKQGRCLPHSRTVPPPYSNPHLQAKQLCIIAKFIVPSRTKNTNKSPTGFKLEPMCNMPGLPLTEASAQARGMHARQMSKCHEVTIGTRKNAAAQGESGDTR